jgi:hypothetical protein
MSAGDWTNGSNPIQVSLNERPDTSQGREAQNDPEKR